MKKIMVLTVFLLFGTSAIAAEEEVRFGFEVQPVSTGNVGSSSTPIPDIKAKADPSIGVRLIALEPLAKAKKVDLTLGYSWDSYGVEMGGVSIGDIKATTLSGTARYHLCTARYFQPYIGAGISQTSFEKSLLAGDTVKTDSASVVGPLLEAGAEIPLPFKGEFYVGLNFTQYYFKEGFLLETNVGNAPISEMKISNPQKFGLWIGRRFW